MLQNYYRISIINVPNELEEEVTALAFSFGASGVSEELSFQQMSADYKPEILKSETHCLQVFFETPPKEDFLFNLKSRFPNLEIKLFEEENKDWMEEWKKGFKSFPLTDKYWIVPSWVTPPEEAQTPIFIDPGMAFGTGTHETTRLAAEIIVGDFLKSIEKKRALDVGTGTGILAMLLHYEGFSDVLATEIEEDARRTARENLKRNHISHVHIPDNQIESVEGSFDLVIANIIDGVLLKIKLSLLKSVKENGYLLLTGILCEREREFREQFEKDSSLRFIERRVKGEWIGLLYQLLKRDQ